ncbi:MAG: hypothetical protein HY513_02690 [Candidatus Aenigmarchaeota archaeon]|nr:hypothetical protein [Candidatus Aenigmarchaeota archaeon]
MKIYQIWFLVSILSLVIISGCVKEQEKIDPDYHIFPIKVLDSGAKVNFTFQAHNIISSNSDKILEGTIELYNANPYIINHPTLNRSKIIIDKVGKNWNFSTVEINLGNSFGKFFTISTNYIVIINSSTLSSNMKQKIVYFVDDDGKVYFAGAYEE